MTAGHVGGDRTVVTTGFTMNARPLEGKVTWGERRLSLSLSLPYDESTTDRTRTKRRH